MKTSVVALVLTLAAAGSASPAELKLELRGGKVTLDARDVTVRQILTEWARVGQTRVVNIERVSTVPVTLQLTSIPESEALDIILRQAAGYVAAPRRAGMAGASAYDRILILATSSAVQTSRAGAPPGGRTAPGMPSRLGVPGPGSPELAPPEPLDVDDVVDDPQAPMARPPAAARPAARQPGIFAPTPAMGSPADVVSSPLQAPAGPANAGTSPTPATGTVTPGIITEPPRAVQPTPGTRPPTPDR